MFLEGLLFIAVTLAIVYLIVYTMSGSTTYQGDKALYDLSVPNTKVLPFDSMPWNSKPCALRFGIFIHAAPKTIQKVDCLDTSAQITSFAPSCDSYEFKMCACDGSNCARCVPTNTYLSRLVNAGDVFELWASGYTNQNDKFYPFPPY